MFYYAYLVDAQMNVNPKTNVPTPQTIAVDCAKTMNTGMGKKKGMPCNFNQFLKFILQDENVCDFSPVVTVVSTYYLIQAVKVPIFNQEYPGVPSLDDTARELLKEENKALTGPVKISYVHKELKTTEYDKLLSKVAVFYNINPKTKFAGKRWSA